MAIVRARDEIVENFYRVRRMLGYLGLSLPVTLFLGGLSLGFAEPSISDYFHTLMRDIFVGTIFAIGVFLLCYTGFHPDVTERLSDDVATTAAGIAAIGVALVPNRGTLHAADTEALAFQVMGVPLSDTLHHVCASTFMLAMAYICYFKFARTAKPKRRKIYRTCAGVILVGFALTLISATFRRMGTEVQTAFVVDHQLVFWSEAIAVWAFSIAWLVKGNRDQQIIQRALGNPDQDQSAPG